MKAKLKILKHNDFAQQPKEHLCQVSASVSGQSFQVKDFCMKKTVSSKTSFSVFISLPKSQIVHYLSYLVASPYNFCFKARRLFYRENQNLSKNEVNYHDSL